MRRCAAFLTVLATAAASPAPASADLSVDVHATGSLVASWHGDGARGCAEAGVCDVAGSVTLTPQAGETSITTSDTNVLEALSLSVERSTVRVLRGAPEHPAGACLDAAGPVELSLGTGRTGGGRVKVALVSSEFPSGGPLSAGRCAGPVPSDLARALPVIDVRSRALRGRNVTLDLRTSRPFAAGAFSGSVSSSLVIRARVSHPKRATSTHVGLPVSPRRRAQRVALLTLGYRATVAGDPLTLAYGAAPGRPCELLDACGLRATETLTVGRAPDLEFFATIPVRRSGTTTLAAALAAVRAGHAPVTLIPNNADTTARVSVEATRDGAPACRDARTVALPPLLGRSRGRRLAISFGGAHYAEPGDPLRTRCPGPARDADRDGALASGTIDLARLGEPQLTVRLVPRPVGDADFASTAGGVVVLDLRRTRAQVRG